MKNSAGSCRRQALRHSILKSVLLLLTLTSFAQTGFGQTANSFSNVPDVTARPQDVLKQATPVVVERRKIVEGTTFDPRFRFEMSLGEQQAGCAIWRIETWSRPDGRLVFQLNDPAEKNVLLDVRYDPQFVEVVLGDKDCNYRIRIERNK